VAPGARRDELKAALEPRWFAPVVDAGSISELLGSAAQRVEVVLLASDGGRGLDQGDVGMLRGRFPGCRLVVVGPEDCASAARAALRAGADGYVPLSEAARRLSLTVAAVLVGQICVPREARMGVAPPVLSYREREVLQLAATGLTNGEIAARLFLSESTVKSHLSSGFRKLGVGSRSEAALALELSAAGGSAARESGRVDDAVRALTGLTV
jgi:DNA-binding NarL/FixJ family response regulator